MRGYTFKVRSYVATRREITKLEIPGLPHVRDQVLKRSDMSGSRLMHSPTSFANGKGDVRTTGDRHVDNSTINGCVLLANVMIDWSPLLLCDVRHIKVVLCDRSICLNVFEYIQNRMFFKQFLNLGFDVHG